MIPAADTAAVESNLQGQKVDMGFAKGAEKHLMGLLTRMYSDPELAVIRELATNALDSHIMAGNTAPIEVTTPTPLSPYFRVKDHGVGLSVEDIHTLYSQYGASLKRDSNAVNGMLGIGCKAPLAYADQFTLTAVKDGVRIQVAISRDEDGGGGMTIVDTSTTSDPNGVEVIVPARAGNQMAAKAANLFRYWPEHSVLLNGSEPARFDGTVKISDTLYVTQGDRYTARSMVVMANVAYPAGELLDPGYLGIPYGYAVVAYVEPGSVDFAPSREALEFTRRTKNRLEQVAAEVKAGLVKAVQKHIEDAPTPQAAVREIIKWKQLLGRNRPDTFRYRGRDIPNQLKRPEARDGQPRKRLLLTENSTYRMGTAYDYPTIELDYFDKAVFVTDYNMGSFTITHKKKLQQWVAKQNFTDPVRQFVLVDFDISSAKPYIDPKRIVPWATIQADQLPRRQSAGGGRLAGSFDVLVGVKGEDRPKRMVEVAGKDIDQSNPVYHIHGNLNDGYRWASMLIQVGVREFTLVCLPQNRLDKFRRENPKFVEVKTVIEDKYKAWVKGLTDDQKKAITMADDGDMSEFQLIKARGMKLKDPAIVEAIRLSSIDVTPLQNARRMYAWVDTDELRGDWTNPLDNYPLCSGHDLRYNRATDHCQHVEAYMNWHYETNLKTT